MLFIPKSSVALLALASSIAANPTGLGRRSLSNVTVKMMPLGDSITGPYGCWRAYLWQKFQSANIKNIDFVGTLTDPTSCNVPFDTNNEGHSGFEAIQIVKNNQLPGWLNATKPDIVFMHLGTNDIWHNASSYTPDIIAAFGTLVDQMRASNPLMRILVAKILPMTPSNCPTCLQRSRDLGTAIGTWALQKTTYASPITVVDQFTGFNTTTMTVDGVHPNDAGMVRMANTWFPPLEQNYKTADMINWICGWLRC